MAELDDLYGDSNVEEHQRNIEERRAERERVAAEIRSASVAALERFEQSRADGPAPNADPQGASPSPVESDPNEGGVIDTTQDVFEQTLGGVYDGLDAILNLPHDLVGFGEEVDVFPETDPSRTAAGALARGVGQFLPGIMPGLGVVRTLSAAAKGIKALKATKAALGTGYLKEGVKGAITFGVADFAAFDGNQGRLTDIIDELSVEYPALDSLVVDYLRSDPGDSDAEGRFKNALEGLMIGAPLDFALHGLRAFAKNKRWTNWKQARLNEDGVAGFGVKKWTEAEAEVSFLSGILDEVRLIKSHLRGGADEVDAGRGALDDAAPTPRAGALAVAEARESVEAIKRMKVAELREAGLMPEKGGRKRDLLEEAEKRLEEAERVAIEEPTGLSPEQTAATRLNTIPANALEQLHGIDPELARRARAGLDEVDKLELEALELMEEATERWTELRTADDSAILKDEEWADFDDRMLPRLTPDQANRVAAHKALPLNTRQQRLRLARHDVEAGAIRRTRAEREVDAHAVMFNPRHAAHWGKLNLDKTQFNEWSQAVLENDAHKLADMADIQGIDLMVDLPDKGQTWASWFKDSEHGKEWERIVQKALDNATQGGPNTRRPKTQSAPFVPDSDKTFKAISSRTRTMFNQLKSQPEGSSPESMFKFVEAMEGRVNLNEAPELMQLMERVQLSMRASLLQRAKKIGGELNTATDLEMAEWDNLAEQLALVSDALSGNVTRIAQTLASRRVKVGAKASNAWFENLSQHMKETRHTAKGRKQLARMMTTSRDAVSLERSILKSQQKSGWDMMVELWTNLILSGPITLAIQPISGAMMTHYLPLEAMAGAALRLDLRGVKTEMAAYRGMMETFRGVVRMSGSLLKVGDETPEMLGTNVLQNTWNTLRHTGTGTLDARTALDDSSRAFTARNFGLQDGTIAGQLSNALGNIIRMPGRMIATADEVAKGLNYNMKLSRDGYEDALANGIVDIDAHVREYMKQATDWSALRNKDLAKVWRARHEDAVTYARQATFQQDLREGMAKSIQSFTGKHPMMKIVIPFVRTPANILKFVGQRTPGLHRISQDVKDDLAAGGVKAQAIHDRINIATAVWGTSMLLVDQGVITGGGPSDWRERQVWIDAGWQPYSIWVGENDDGTQNWISFQRGDPMGMFMGLSADLATAFTNLDDGDPEAGELAAAAMFALSNNLKSRSYFMGLSSLLNAIDNPERSAGRYAQNIFSNLVPNILAQVRRHGPVGDNDAMREVDGLLDTLQNRIPYYAHRLQPKRNIYGEIQRYPSGAGPSIINPFYSTKNGISPKMLKDLRDGTIDIRKLNPEQQVSAWAIQLDYSYSMNAYDSMYDGKIELSPEQRDYWIVQTGLGLKEDLQWLVTSHGWNSLSNPVSGYEEDSGKYKAFDRLIKRRRKLARRKTINHFDELRSKLEVRILEQRERLMNRPDAVLGDPGLQYTF